MRYNLFIIGLLLSNLLIGQEKNDSVSKSQESFQFSGYVDAYYCYDFNQPDHHNRPGFFYSHNRHNEVNLNLGFIKAAYTASKVRANLALGAGTYMNANYSTEPGVLKNLYESNVGVKLSKKKNLWLDAGIFASHIGFESAVSKDCWGLTRSILADNSPYYESGAKLTFITDSSKWLFSVLALNGWQHITRTNGNNTPAFGTQITYTPNTKVTINYSTFIGNEKPDSSIQMRYFHNLYGMFHFTDKFHLTAGFDIGMEQKSKGSSEYNLWYSPVIIAKIAFNDKWSVAGRAEYYSDENGVIIATGTENGFQTMGFSLNLDYKISENAVWRIEGRTLKSTDDVFIKNEDITNTNSFITTSLSVSF